MRAPIASSSYTSRVLTLACVAALTACGGGSGGGGGTGGNLDVPFCDLLERDRPEACHSLELSSFQLETVESLSVDVAIVLGAKVWVVGRLVDGTLQPTSYGVLRGP